MTSNFRRERVTHRIEFVVPAPPPYGAARSDVELAIYNAHEEMGPKRAQYDDSVRFAIGDDELIVWYEIEQVIAQEGPK